jgi:hypothetical protein
VKKRPFFLFEILIALSLTAILLTFFFSFFSETAKMEKKLEKARMAITARAHVQTRLQNLLSSLQSTATEPSSLYTKHIDQENSPSLIAIFDNGVDPEPTFSGPLMGRLYIDEDHNLALASWPLSKSKHPPWRKEVLLSHVQSLEFAFLGDNKAPEDKSREKIHPINAQYAWRSHHPASESAIPSLVRLSVQEEGSKEPLRFAFILPSNHPHVKYQGKKI